MTPQEQLIQGLMAHGREMIPSAFDPWEVFTDFLTLHVWAKDDGIIWQASREGDEYYSVAYFREIAVESKGENQDTAICNVLLECYRVGGPCDVPLCDRCWNRPAFKFNDGRRGKICSTCGMNSLLALLDEDD